MSYGFYYDMGKRVGYDISLSSHSGMGIYLSNVSSKDKARIIREIVAKGYKRSDITVQRVEL